MQVLPSFENLFSATGYLGEAPQLSSVYGEYFNAPLVFPLSSDFINNSSLTNGLFDGYPGLTVGDPYYAHNGLHIIPKNDTNENLIFINPSINPEYLQAYAYISALSVNNTNYEPFFSLQYSGAIAKQVYLGNTTNELISMNNTGYGGYGFVFQTVADNSPYASLQSLDISYWIVYNDSNIMPIPSISASGTVFSANFSSVTQVPYENLNPSV